MDAPQPLCAKAVSNLHVVTELGLEQQTRCAPREASAPAGTTTLECTAINDKLQPIVNTSEQHIARSISI